MKTGPLLTILFSDNFIVLYGTDAINFPIYYSWKVDLEILNVTRVL